MVWATKPLTYRHAKWSEGRCRLLVSTRCQPSTCIYYWTRQNLYVLSTNIPGGNHDHSYPFVQAHVALDDVLHRRRPADSQPGGRRGLLPGDPHAGAANDRGPVHPWSQLRDLRHRNGTHRRCRHWLRQQPVPVQLRQRQARRGDVHQRLGRRTG